MNSKINVRQLCFIIAIIFSVTKFYVLPATAASASGEACYLSVLLNFVIDFLLLLVCIYIIKNQPMQDVYDSSIKIFGKPLTKTVYLLYGAYFLMKAFIPILEQKNTISLTFYESQPTLLIFMPFFIVSFYLITKGVTAFCRSVELMGFIWLFAIVIIFALSVPVGEYSSLLPIIQPASKIANGSKEILLWFGDPVSLLFFAEFLQDKKGLTKKTTISFFIGAIVTVILIVIFYSIFQDIAPRQYYAPIKMSKYSITLSNIGRLDYFAALMFSTISVYSVTMPIMLASICISKVLPLKNKWIVPLITTFIELVAVFIFQNEIFDNIVFINDYILPFMLIMSYVFPIVLLSGILLCKKRFKTDNKQVNYV